MKTPEFEQAYESMQKAINKNSKEGTEETEAQMNLDVMYAAEALIDSLMKELPPDVMHQYTNEATDVMAHFFPVRNVFWKQLGWED